MSKQDKGLSEEYNGKDRTDRDRHTHKEIKTVTLLNASR